MAKNGDQNVSRAPLLEGLANGETENMDLNVKKYSAKVSFPTLVRHYLNLSIHKNCVKQNWTALLIDNIERLMLNKTNHVMSKQCNVYFVFYPE